jgi:UDP-N-acetylglucosamine--N-acetylmuramyl-(pentapeptide) pyrophosphoryl-undecaprenol N-acetylglucosamine transferase
MPTDARTLLIAAGGTGGHIYPGIAVADEVRRRDPRTRIVFVGTRRGLESRLVPDAGYPLVLLPILPLNQVGAWGLVKGVLALPWALARALALVARRRPEAVLGVGGYAGGPLLFMAALLGVRTVILEPNARAGFTNRVLRPFVRHAAVSYEVTRRAFGSKGVVTGTPVRDGFSRVPPRDHRPPFSVLVFGGSQGSRALNRGMVDALPHLPGREALRLVHQTGDAEAGTVRSAYAAAGRPQDEVLPFLHDMDARLTAADLVVCRSGATTCAELTVAGKASVLVPFARSADDHQKGNARAMQEAGASRMVEEHELSGERLAAVLRETLETPGRLAAMEEASRRLGRADAAARVADLLLGGRPSGEAC